MHVTDSSKLIHFSGMVMTQSLFSSKQDLLHFKDVIANSSILGKLLHLAHRCKIYLIEFCSQNTEKKTASLLGKRTWCTVPVKQNVNCLSIVIHVCMVRTATQRSLWIASQGKIFGT